MRNSAGGWALAWDRGLNCALSNSGVVLRVAQHFCVLRKDQFTFADLNHCLRMGTVVSRQYDADYDDDKYVVYGEALDEREMAAVVRFGYNAEVVVITAYQLREQDYEN